MTSGRQTDTSIWVCHNPCTMHLSVLLSYRTTTLHVASLIRDTVCVEAGSVAGWQRLDPGDTFEGGQMIKSFL